MPPGPCGLPHLLHTESSKEKAVPPSGPHWSCLRTPGAGRRSDRVERVVFLEPCCASRRPWPQPTGALEPLTSPGRGRVECAAAAPLAFPHYVLLGFDSFLTRGEGCGPAALHLELDGRTEKGCGQKPAFQGSRSATACAPVCLRDSVLIPAPPLSFLGAPRRARRVQKFQTVRRSQEVESRVPSCQVRKLKPRGGACLRPQASADAQGRLRGRYSAPGGQGLGG